MLSDDQTLAFKAWICTLSNLSGPQCSHLRGLIWVGLS